MDSFSQYVDKQSILHKLNPSLKIVSVFFLIVLVFLPTGMFGQIILLFTAIALWIMAKLSWKRFKTILKSVSIMVILLLLVNWISYKQPGLVADVSTKTIPLFNINWGYGGSWRNNNWFIPEGLLGNILCAHGNLYGGNIVACEGLLKNQNVSDWIKLNWPGYDYTVANVYGANHELMGYVVLVFKTQWYSLSTDVFMFTAYVTIKIMVMILLVTILTSTTTSVQLSFAIEDILSPLRYLRLPVNEWSMTISIAIRFVPSLLQEAQKILKAQASRGIDFTNGKFREKVRSLVSLVVPMFSIAFYKADDLANAMEARAYNPRYTRTRYRSYKIYWHNWLFLLFITIIFGFFIMYVIKHFWFDPFGWPEAILNYGV